MDRRTLSDYNIVPESTLHFVLDQTKKKQEDADRAMNEILEVEGMAADAATAASQKEKQAKTDKSQQIAICPSVQIATESEKKKAEIERERERERERARERERGNTEYIQIIHEISLVRAKHPVVAATELFSPVYAQATCALQCIDTWLELRHTRLRTWSRSFLCDGVVECLLSLSRSLAFFSGKGFAARSSHRMATE